ncbi:MAG TPA: hypothetical protein VFY73_11255 [Ideonella sp.]|uniref:hypothetical protein n=1 Tax=Ideonella sp. TaxID=1929293 RepID=UPI002E36C19E|nr:hypothetical protein [Ideonella sp.]HEX5684597.1 hypothetical protein [Ideonella sp.]
MPPPRSLGLRCPSLAAAVLLLQSGCTTWQPMPPVRQAGVFEQPPATGAPPRCEEWQSATSAACSEPVASIGDHYPPVALALYAADQQRLQWVVRGSNGINVDARYNAALWPVAGYALYRGAFGSGEAMRRELLRLGLVAGAAFGVLSNRTPGIEAMYFDAAGRLACESVAATRYLYLTREISGPPQPARCGWETCGWSIDNKPSLDAVTGELRAVLASYKLAQRSLMSELEARKPAAVPRETDTRKARQLELKGGGAVRSAAVGNPVQDIAAVLNSRAARAQRVLDAVVALRQQIELAGPRLNRRADGIDLKLRTSIQQNAPELAQLKDRIEQLATAMKDLPVLAAQLASGGKAQSAPAPSADDSQLAGLRSRLSDASWRRWQDFEAWFGVRLEEATSKGELWVADDQTRKAAIDEELKAALCNLPGPTPPAAAASAQPAASAAGDGARPQTPATPSTRDLPTRTSP